MELKQINNKLTSVIKKYKYAILVLLIGLLLMNFPTTKPKNTRKISSENQPVITASDEERLQEILGQISGVGRVEVMLTQASGAENIYQTDENRSKSDSSDSVNGETVIITDADRNETPLIRKTLSPSYLGAIIVCQGADKPEVRLFVVEAVSKITGLRSDCICVVKMK